MYSIYIVFLIQPSSVKAEHGSALQYKDKLCTDTQEATREKQPFGGSRDKWEEKVIEGDLRPLTAQGEPEIPFTKAHITVFIRQV